MLTKMTIAVAAALMLGPASVAMAANENDQSGGSRSLGSGAAASGGINSAQHPKAAAACAKLRGYDPSNMTYIGQDGVRHPCP